MNDEMNLPAAGDGEAEEGRERTRSSASLPIENQDAAGETGRNVDAGAGAEEEQHAGDGLSGPVPDGFEDVEPWAEAADGGALLDELEQVLNRFVVLPKWAAETLALWVVHTYAFESRNVSTYIGIESPERRCGKTTLLEVLQRLVNRPAVTANISSSAFFRAIGELRPTLMIDEADTFLRGNDTLRGILNAGYTRETAYVVRSIRTRNEREQAQTPNTKNQTPDNSQTPNSQIQSRTPMPLIGAENFQIPGSKAAVADGGVREFKELGGQGGEKAQSHHWRVARFSCWCPKVIALIGRLPGTLADRCIVIRMQRKTRMEQCERIRTIDAKPLRRKCARFVRDHALEISRAHPALPRELNDRAADIWEPLLAVADLAGGKWPEAARQAAVGLSAGAEAHNPIGSLLIDIALSFGGPQTKKIFTQTLVQQLNFYLERPWAEAVRGKEITELWLAKQLRPFGIRSKNIRIGEQQGKGYYFADFQEAFRRYVPNSEINALREDLQAEFDEEKAEKARTEGAGNVAAVSGDAGARPEQRQEPPPAGDAEAAETGEARDADDGEPEPGNLQ